MDFKNTLHSPTKHIILYFSVFIKPFILNSAMAPLVWSFSFESIHSKEWAIRLHTDILVDELSLSRANLNVSLFYRWFVYRDCVLFRILIWKYRIAKSEVLSQFARVKKSTIYQLWIVCTRFCLSNIRRNNKIIRATNQKFVTMSSISNQLFYFIYLDQIYHWTVYYR